MPKGYWIGHVDVHDAEAYESYRTANAAPLAEYGGRFLVRGGGQEVREGHARKRTVVIEFKDHATALACYESEAYQAAKALRLLAGTADMVIVEGWEG